MPYQYKSPTERGYIQIKLTRAQHTALFKGKKRDLRTYTDVFYNGNYFLAEHFTRRWWVVLMCIPALIFGTILDGAPSTWSDLKSAFNQKRYGSFRADQGPLDVNNYSPEFQPVIEQWLKSQK